MWEDSFNEEPTVEEIYALFSLRRLPRNHGQYYKYNWEDLNVISRPLAIKH